MRHRQEQLALLLARKLLQELLEPAKPGVIPPRVRDQAAAVLRHFPHPAKINLLYANLKATPDELQE